MWIAKKDFPFRGKQYKKGDEVRVSDSIAKTLKDEGKIGPKTKTTEKKED